MEARCDLVIPCRDEAAALPALLGRVPAGVRVIVVDNGSTRRHRRRGAPPTAPGWWRNRCRATALRYMPDCEAATAVHVAVMDGDGSMNPP